MYGSHDGELNRCEVSGNNEDDCLTDIKEDFIKMLRETSLDVGDYFRIEKTKE